MRSSLPTRLLAVASCASALALASPLCAQTVQPEPPPKWPPTPLHSFVAEPACEDVCRTLSFLQLDADRVLAFWSGEDYVMRAQTIGARSGKPLGEALELGPINTTGREDYYIRTLRTFVLADGDLAMFGALRDGRITFTRGSLMAERRVAAQVIRAANDVTIGSFAAAVTPEGFALLVLGIPATERKYEPALPAQIELHALGPRGDALRPVRRWKGAGSKEARLAVCGDQLHLSRASTDSVFVRSLDLGSQKLSADRRLALVGVDDLSPLYCRGSDATLLASWGTENGGTLPKIAWATLSASTPLPKQAWTKLALPGTPYALETAATLRADAQAVTLALLGEPRGAHVLLELDAGVIKPSPLPMRGRGDCLPLADGAHVLCGTWDRAARADGCPKPAILTFSLFGPASASLPIPPALAANFFLPTQIEDPRKRSLAEDAYAKSRLWCGERGFDKLLQATRKWCKQASTDSAPHPESGRICAEDSMSLKLQLTTCSDLPAACRDHPESKRLSVSREAFEAGTPVIALDHCLINFTQQGASWSLQKVECSEGC